MKPLRSSFCYGKSPSGNGRQALTPVVRQLTQAMSTKENTGGEDRGANPLPAGKHRPRPRKPPGLRLRFPPRPKRLPKAPSPVPGGIGPLVPEETSVSSGEGGTQVTPPRWESVPLRERALQTRRAHPSLSTDARHRPSCQLDSEREQSRRKHARNRRVGEATASKQKGHVCPRTRRRGDRRVRARRLSLKRNRQRFCKGTGKEETRKLCLTSAGEILCRSPGPHPGGQILTLPGVATPRKAGPGRPGPASRPPPAFSCYRRALGPRARRLGVCARVWEPGPGCPGTCSRARAPARARRSGSRARSVLAFRESIRTRRARSLPGLPGAGASGREEEQRLLFLSLFLRVSRPRGDLTLGPTSHFQEQRSAGPERHLG